jgi:hypothetical protein
MANALKRYRLAKTYHAKLNLMAKVHREIEPILAKQRDAENWTTRHDTDTQGFCFDLAKYITEGHAVLFQRGHPSDMGKENEPFNNFSGGLQRAEQEQRNLTK